MGLVVSLDGSTAYFASNQLKSGYGWDIFSFIMPELARPDEVTMIKGNVKTSEGMPEEQDIALELKNLTTKEVTKVKVDKETGNYARVVRTQPNEDLIISVKKKGIAFSSKYVKTDQLKKVVEAPLSFEWLEVGKEYKLNDINFESNSYALDEVARSVIDEFILYLEDNH